MANKYQIAFRRVTFVDRLLRLWPPYRRKREKQAREALDWIAENPIKLGPKRAGAD